MFGRQAGMDHQQMKVFNTICLRQLKHLQEYDNLMRTYALSKECKQKGYFDFDQDVPINEQPDHTCCNFHREHSQWENRDLGYLCWNTVFLRAFHMKDILKLPWQLNMDWLIRQQQQWPLSLLWTNRKPKMTSLHSLIPSNIISEWSLDQNKFVLIQQ